MLALRFTAAVFALCALPRALCAAAPDYPALTNLWSVNIGGTSDSSPAVGSDGTIFFGDRRGQLWALNPDGSRKWVFEAGREITSSPAIADDGTIYFGSRDRKFYALQPDGKPKWVFKTGGWVDSSPAIAADGTVYFGSWDTNFYALGPDGTSKWRFPTGGPIVSSPAVGADGTLYFGSHDRNLYALLPNGQKKWEFATGGPILSSPALNGDDCLYFTSVDGNLLRAEPGWHAALEIQNRRDYAILADHRAERHGLCRRQPGTLDILARRQEARAQLRRRRYRDYADGAGRRHVRLCARIRAAGGLGLAPAMAAAMGAPNRS